MNTMAQPSLKKSASQLGIAVFAMMGLHQIVTGLASYLIASYFPEFLNTSYGFWLLSYLPLYLIFVPIFFLIAKSAPTTETDKEKVKLPFNTFAKWWFISMAAMWIFNLVSTIINFGIGYIKGAPISNPIAEVAMSSGMIYNIIFGVIVAPIGEEFIFRYMFYKKLSGYGDKVYIIVSSLCFAMMHGNLSQLLYAFVLGAIFAYIMARTRNIVYSIAMHVVINAYGMILAPFALKYPMLLSVLGMAVMVVNIFGVVLFMRTKKKGFIIDAPTLTVSEKPVKESILNLGMILTIAIGTALCLLVILM